MPKNKTHTPCGEYLKSLYYRDQTDGDHLVKVGMLYCPTCNVYFIVDHNVAEVKNIAKY